MSAHQCAHTNINMSTQINVNGVSTLSAAQSEDALISQPKSRSIATTIPAFGIIMALISVICFSFSAVIVKLLTELNAIQILVIRCVIQLVFYAIVVFARQYRLFGERGHRIDLLIRCISGTISLIAVFSAYRLMPIGDATTIHVSSPVFVIVFAYVMLHEPITFVQIVGAVLTLIGVVIIARPQFLFSPQSNATQVNHNRLEGSLLAVLASIAAALSMISLRRLKSTPSAVVVMWYSASVVVFGCALVFSFGSFVWPQTSREWTLLALIGLAGIGDQFFLTVALQYEIAAPVALTRTFTVALTFVWQVVFGFEQIEGMSLIGAALITCCVALLAVHKWHSEDNRLTARLTPRRANCCKRIGDK